MNETEPQTNNDAGEARSTPSGSGRAWFERAARAYLELLREVPAGRLDDDALGEWTLRDLLGHTSRAFVTTETYLAASPDPEAPILDGPADYYGAVMAASADTRGAVAQRGRDAGASLGDDPVGATIEIAERVLDVVDESPNDATVSTPWGVIRLGDYLSTRAFELTVHGIDVARALGIGIPDALGSEARQALHVLTAAATDEQAVTLLLALTGRGGLPDGFSIIS